MNNYKKSLYVLNKYSENIIYRAGNEIVEVTLEDYLKENPTHTKEDFIKIKNFSDEMFRTEALGDTRYRRRKTSIDNFSNDNLSSKETPLDIIIQLETKIKIDKSVEKLLNENSLTEIQKRRFIMHIYENKSLRDIAKLEGVTHIAIHKSIKYAFEKLKNFFHFEG